MFSYRLLIATTDKLHHVARRTIDDQEKQVAFVGLSDLLTAEVDWPSNPLDLRAVPAAEARQAEGTSARGDPRCGEGVHEVGSRSAHHGVRDRQDPDLPVHQGEARRRAHPGPGAVAVAAEADDAGVAGQRQGSVRRAARLLRRDCGRSDEDAAVAHTSELGVPVTTDPSEIAAFLRRRSGPRVVFSTYQSSPQIAAAFALGRVPAFDLVIADEAHRVAGRRVIRLRHGSRPDGDQGAGGGCS